MKLSEIKAIATARSPGPWQHDCGNQTIEYRGEGGRRILASGKIINYKWRDDILRFDTATHLYFDEDADFIEMAANNIDKLIAIAEEAKDLADCCLNRGYKNLPSRVLAALADLEAAP